MRSRSTPLAERYRSLIKRSQRERLEMFRAIASDPSHELVQRVERVDTGPGEPPSITEDPTERRDEPASDHLPVVARFRLD